MMADHWLLASSKGVALGALGVFCNTFPAVDIFFA